MRKGIGMRGFSRVMCLMAGLVLSAAAAPDVRAMGSDTSSTPAAARGSADYQKAERAVKDKDWKGAIALLEKVIAGEPRNANALNYLGYSHRNLGEREKALGYYKRALDIEPNHLGANEYLGELYLQMGDLPAAEERMKVLERACRNCEEKRELAEKIEKYKKSKGS